MSGSRVSRVCIGEQLTIFTDTGHELAIESDALFTTAHGDQAALTAGTFHENGAHLGLLYNQRISDSAIHDDGTLSVRFENGSVLTVGPDDDFEAWSIVGPDGQRAVCMPGGDLSVWTRGET